MKQQPADVQSTIDADNLGMILPEFLPVSVILERKLSDNPWLEATWKAVAISISTSSNTRQTLQGIYQGNIKSHYLYAGLQVRLFKDECESYYHNLSSPSPLCYVVAHQNDADEPPKPFLITMSFDEAHAYMEGEDEVYDVAVPPELYKWTEAFLLLNYAPKKRKKRKRDSWKEQAPNGSRE